MSKEIFIKVKMTLADDVDEEFTDKDIKELAEEYERQFKFFRGDAKAFITLEDEDAKQISELKAEIERKDYDYTLLKELYKMKSQEIDNYRTEKYDLGKRVEEIRQIKLSPKQKEIFIKGFEMCEQQCASHIVDLQQQLQEKDAEIEHLKDGIKMLDGIKRYDIGELLTENIKLKQSQNQNAVDVLGKIKYFIEQPRNSIYYDTSIYVETEGLRNYIDQLKKELTQENK